jgi:hypothetical protein
LPSHCEESGPSAADRYCTKEPNDATHAGWEEDLGTHAVRAVVLEEVVALLPGLVARVVIIVVEADERDGLVLEAARIEGSSAGLSGDHLQALWEGLDLLILGAGPLEIAGKGQRSVSGEETGNEVLRRKRTKYLSRTESPRRSS